MWYKNNNKENDYRETDSNLLNWPNEQRYNYYYYYYSFQTKINVVDNPE